VVEAAGGGAELSGGGRAVVEEGLVRRRAEQRQLRLVERHVEVIGRIGWCWAETGGGRRTGQH
jgi:hypothetical protein